MRRTIFSTHSQGEMDSICPFGARPAVGGDGEVHGGGRKFLAQVLSVGGITIVVIVQGLISEGTDKCLITGRKFTVGVRESIMPTLFSRRHIWRGPFHDVGG